MNSDSSGNSRLEEIRSFRLDKLARLRELGIDPYPPKYSQDLTSIQSAREKMGETLSVAGRLLTFREHGNIVFADLKDESGKIQIFFQKAKLTDNFSLLKLIDSGDFLGVTGQVFTTQAGEITVNVDSFELLSKSVRPLPDEWHGLKDEEARYRLRYVDLMLTDQLRDLFRKKAIFWNSMRGFLQAKGFLEVETPVLENTAGGADANPFVTHHNALDIDLYLRISMGELWQKRLMVGGFAKTFEIGRQFRNEGLSREHLQDYTQMEFYWAYADFSDSMKLVEEMYKYVVQAAFGSLKFTVENFDIDLGQPWEIIDYSTIIKDKYQIDLGTTTVELLRAKLDTLGVKYAPADDKGRLIDHLWKTIRKSIAGPAFLVGHPVEVSPLAKRDPSRPGLVQRYQVILGGSEMGNGYSELNDPIDQAQRFAAQQELRDRGDAEAQMNDSDFVTALEYAMPPVTGFGVSERLFSFVAGKPIRETVLFPLLRPETAAPSAKQDFDHKLVIVIDSGLPPWQIMNTSGHIAAYLGNKMTEKFDTGKFFITKDGSNLPRNSQYPIVTLSATPEQLKALISRVRDSGLLHIGYVPEMMKTTDDKKLAAALAEKSDSDIQFAGIGIFGPKDKIDALTRDFPLWEAAVK